MPLEDANLEIQYSGENEQHIVMAIQRCPKNLKGVECKIKAAIDVFELRFACFLVQFTSISTLDVQFMAASLLNDFRPTLYPLRFVAAVPGADGELRRRFETSLNFFARSNQLMA